jgi:uncharacterized protein (TIGR02246 family)
MGERERVASLVEEVEQAWNTHDMRRFADCFAADADFVNVLGQWLQGREEIERTHTRVHETIFADSRMELQLASVRDVGPGIQVAHVKWRMTGHAVGGPQRTMEPRTGLFSWVLRQREGTQEIVSSHNTDVIEVPSGDPLRRNSPD